MTAKRREEEAEAVAQRLIELRDQFENPPIEIGKPLPGRLCHYGPVQDWNFDVGLSLYRRCVATDHQLLVRSLRRRSVSFQRAVAREVVKLEQALEELPALRDWWRMNAQLDQLAREVLTLGDLGPLRRKLEALAETARDLECEILWAQRKGA